jgi:hypothetical protein
VEEEAQLVLLFHGQPREKDVTTDESGVAKPPICPWSAQKDDGRNTKVKLQSFKMRTSNGSTVFVSVPKYNQDEVEERYWYDCHTYALNCYQKFGYVVEAESLWDVLHDPVLATKVAENLETPVLQGRTGRFDLEEGKLPKTKSPFLEMNIALLEHQPMANDIMVWWECVQIPEDTGPWYIRAHHSLVLKELSFREQPDGRDFLEEVKSTGKYLRLDAKAMTKNGSNQPKEATLRELAREYRGTWLGGAGPVGIYRLVGHLGESSPMKKRQADSRNRILSNSDMAGKVVRQERCSGEYKVERYVASEDLEGRG